MSLISSLKPRPLNRGTGTLRDDRLFLVACDDTYAPKQYFDFLRLSRVQIHVVETDDSRSAAVYVLERLNKFKVEDDDERWMVLDTDHCIQGSHFPSFIQAITEARQAGIKIALSRPCFELWLLLHHLEENEVKTLKDAAATEARLREVLGGYNKTNLKPEHYPLASIAAAIQRAERLDAQVEGGDRPDGNTTRVYQLLKAILGSIPTGQRPEELRKAGLSC
jgi:hypothetical protein